MSVRWWWTLGGTASWFAFTLILQGLGVSVLDAHLFAAVAALSLMVILRRAQRR